MEIKYLQILRDNPNASPLSITHPMPIKPISIEEIQSLETSYNGGIEFPAALRELLFLAGKYCSVLSFLAESQATVQSEVRSILENHGVTISRPFFVIDFPEYPTQFLFVYLDSGDDPIVYEYYRQLQPRSLDITLSELIKSRVELRVIQGRTW